MTTKLTLSIEKEIIEQAKGYAKATGRSLSNLVQSYLERLIAENTVKEEEVPEELKSLFGCIKPEQVPDDKAAIREITWKKHMK